jgi:hypothetical protein
MTMEVSLAFLLQKYLLYQYKSTNTDAKAVSREREDGDRGVPDRMSCGV